MTRRAAARPTGLLRAGALVGLATLLLVSPACDTRARRIERQLTTLWDAYRHQYMGAAGEVRDPLRNGLVTSEAQSYALLQAAWLGDRETFDRVHAWTETHLVRPDHLHAWLWDPATGRIVDGNSATDADTDIALALVIASARFEEIRYALAARDVVRAIRQHASIAVGDSGDWIPSAGNWAGRERIINLSYFAPYAYLYFHRLDPEGGWMRALDAGYALVAEALGDGTTLPPDFVSVSATGHLTSLPAGSQLSDIFSYDAVRVLWRLDLDCRWRGEPRACTAVSRLVHRLEAIRVRDGRFTTRYSAAGAPLALDESLSFYGAFLPAYSREQPRLAQRWRLDQFSDRSLDDLGRSGRRYYDANWVWFGLAAADGFITAHLPPVESVEPVNRDALHGTN